MRTMLSEHWLRAAGILLLTLSAISLLAVAERAIAALWQWYKFFGYEAAGVITLSKKTGVVFVAASALVILACTFVKNISEARKAMTGVRLSKWALLISCASLVLYFAVALSPLNAWRP